MDKKEDNLCIFSVKQRRYCRLLESGMEPTRAKRQIDYVSDSGNKEQSIVLRSHVGIGSQSDCLLGIL